MNHPTLVYTPAPTLLWLRVLVREFMMPEVRVGRLLAGPALLVLGFAGMVWGRTGENAGFVLGGSVLVGVGLGWSSWPLAAAALSVLRNGGPRQRKPIKLLLTAGVIELTVGEARRLFPLDELEARSPASTGDLWLRFRGNRYLLLPAVADEGDPALFLSAVLAHEPEAAPPPISVVAPQRMRPRT